MQNLKNIDFAAFAVLAITMLLEGAVWLVENDGVLEQLPPQVVPVVAMIAAFARWRMTKPELPKSE